ncbi:MAG: pantoate--beta-alanine ligase [Deltaproteobacteria bacterium]|nr:pantoate--beta-alanine ligase [Deltaproteobacteria bacterium]
MHVVTDLAELRAWRRSARGRIGFVPTMGFLHAGHASLMDRVRPEVDALVVSSYVNPLQFGPHEDLTRYPRDPTGDERLCADRDVDVLFRPEGLYPEGFVTAVTVHGSLTDRLEGAHRPGHFEGVATVVARLLCLVLPSVAAFGEKDWQQLAVIRRLVRDLGLPVEIVGCPLIRDEDGLALSSRNKYLSPDDRKRARTLSQALFAIRAAFQLGERDARRLAETGRHGLAVDRLDYLEVAAAADLAELQRVDRPARALVAAVVGTTRLIDNVAIGGEPTWT